jgi:hypothetical protein
MEKSYKTSKHTTNYIYYIKMPKKLTFKNGLREKIASFAYLMWRILKKKKLNQNKDANILSVGMAEFMMMRA